MTAFLRNLTGTWRSMLMAVTMGLIASFAGAESAMPVYQPDGSIQSTKATVRMNDNGNVTVTDHAGGTYTIYLASVFKANGGWLSNNTMSHPVRVTDSAGKTTRFTADFTPPPGSVVTTPIPFSSSMTLKSDGRIRLIMQFNTTEPILNILTNPGYKVDFKPRDVIVGHVVKADGDSYTINTPPVVNAIVVLKTGTIQTAEYFSDVPDRSIRYHRNVSGGEYLRDYNNSDNKMVQLSYSYSSVSGNLVSFDIQLPDEPPAYGPATPLFYSNGKILSETATANMISNGTIEVSDNLGATHCIYLSVFYKIGNGWSTTYLTANQLRSVNQTSKTVSYSGIFKAPINPSDLTQTVDIPYVFSMRLLDSGKIRIQADLTPPAGSTLFDHFNNCEINSYSSRSAYVGHSVLTNTNSYSIGSPPSGTVVLEQGTSVSQIRFLSDVTTRSIGFSPVTTTYQKLTDDANNLRTYFKASGPDNRVSVDIELPNEPTNYSPEYYSDVDFWKQDQLRMPLYGKSVNLLSNPGFEHGFQCWQWNTVGNATTSDGNRLHQIDPTVKHTGNRSLKMIAKAGQYMPQLATFAVPVDAGQTYTLSFYAKADKNTPVRRLSVVGMTAIYPTMVDVLPSGWTTSSPALSLTDGWVRYQYTFVAPNSALSIGFSPYYSSENGAVWLDSVQLEKASAASSFTQRSYSLSFVSDRSDQIYAPNETFSASVRIVGTANASGTLKVYAQDFHGIESLRQTSPFVISSNGETTVSQTWHANLPRGIYAIRMEAQIGSQTYRDFGRLAIMPSVSLTQPGRSFFALNGGAHIRFGEWARHLAYYTKIGIGTAIHFDPPPASLYPLLAQYQMTHFSSIFEGAEKVQSLNINLRTDYDLTPAELSSLQTYAYNKALANPQINYWKLLNEPDMSTTHTEPVNMQKMLTTLQAAVNGIRQANPQAKIMTNDPVHMDAAQGIPYLNSFLQVGGGSFCDIAAIHTYRKLPESPDLDSDLGLFLDMLQTRNFTGDVWLTEGIYHNNFVLPMYGINTHKGATTDFYRGGPFTYSMGWGERMCAAYTARSWLQSLKYGERVKVHVDWGVQINTIYDYDMVPGVPIFSSNTLVHLLGGSTFSGQPAMGTGIRSYVFTDPQGYHVAAIWYYSDETDRGISVAPSLDISGLVAAYGASNLELIDFMGNVTAPSSELPLQPWPLFLRAKAGTAAFLIQELEDIDQGGGY